MCASSAGRNVSFSENFVYILNEWSLIPSQLNSSSKKILPNSQEKTWGGIAFLVMLLVDVILYRFFMGLYGGLLLALILSNSFYPLYFLFSEIYPGLLQTYFTLFRWAFSGLVKERGESRDTPLELC